MFEASVRRVFAAAHALRLPDGSSEPIHGHHWEVEVVVRRDGLDELETVMDFHALEASLDAILQPWQNRCLNDDPAFSLGGYNPTAERVAQHIAESLIPTLPPQISLSLISVGEAPGCRAIYRPTG